MECIDIRFRILNIVEVIHARDGNFDLFYYENFPKTLVKHVMDEMDWNALLRRFNEHVTKRVNALGDDPSKGLKGKFAAIKTLINRGFPNEAEKMATQLALRGASPKGKADIVSTYFIEQYLSYTSMMCARLEACRARQEMGDVAMALFQYKIDHNEYPQKLDDLTPAYIKRIPKDPFNGKNLFYKKSGEHFMLSSVGYNRENDYEQALEYEFTEPMDAFLNSDIGFHSDPKIWCDPTINH